MKLGIIDKQLSSQLIMELAVKGEGVQLKSIKNVPFVMKIEVSNINLIFNSTSSKFFGKALLNFNAASWMTELR